MKKHLPVIFVLFLFAHANCFAQALLMQSPSEAEAVATKNYDQALKSYTKSANAGDTAAMFQLGWMYENGLGVTKDYVQAVKWYQKSADAGDASAMINLGVLYENGFGVDKDFGKAAAWYQKSAETGNAMAMFNVGVMYQNGYGVITDYTRALKWYLRSAEAGNYNAMLNLSVMYQRGTGVPFDSAQAVKWCRQAEDGWEKDKYNHATNSAYIMASYGVFDILVANIEPDSIKTKKYLYQAVSYLQKACELQPNEIHDWLNLGIAYSRINNFDSTEYCWNHAAELDPHYPMLMKDYYHELCIGLMNAGLRNATNKDYAACISCFYRALKYDNTNADVWYNLGGAYYTIARYDSARIAWQQCLKLKPDYDNAKQGLQAIPSGK